MKCQLCQIDNKDDAKHCKKCGANLNVAPLWTPSWKWHIKSLAIVYVVLLVFYVLISGFLSRVPEPYRMRDIPSDLLPWIKK